MHIDGYSARSLAALLVSILNILPGKILTQWLTWKFAITEPKKTFKCSQVHRSGCCAKVFKAEEFFISLQVAYHSRLYIHNF